MLTYTAFEEHRILSQGGLEKIAIDVKRRLKSHPDGRILIFSDSSGKQMDLDLSGTEKDVLERLKVYLASGETAPASPGPGRPKLGVVAREVSLLPSHWEWLSIQGGGASATIRRLIEEKMKSGTQGKDKVKQSQETTFKFLSAIAGDLPRFEEAIRFLYRRDKKRFRELMTGWPKDLIEHAMTLAEPAFSSEAK